MTKTENLARTVDRSHIIEIVDELNALPGLHLPEGMVAYWKSLTGAYIEFGVIYPTSINADAFADRVMGSMRLFTSAHWPADIRDTYHPEKGHLEMTPEKRAEAESWGGPIDWDAEQKGLIESIVAAGYPADRLDQETRVVAIQAPYATRKKAFRMIPEDYEDRD